MDVGLESCFLSVTNKSWLAFELNNSECTIENSARNAKALLEDFKQDTVIYTCMQSRAVEKCRVLKQ